MTRNVDEIIPFLWQCEDDLGFLGVEFETWRGEPDEELICWFGHRGFEADGSRFKHFGMDGTGSIYALWLQPGKDSWEQAPVAFFDSEGVGNAIIASNLEAFVYQLCADRCYGAYSGDLEPGHDDDTPLTYEEEQSLERFKALALDFFRRHELPDVMADFRQAHQTKSFQRWIDEAIQHKG